MDAVTSFLQWMQLEGAKARAGVDRAMAEQNLMVTLAIQVIMHVQAGTLDADSLEKVKAVFVRVNRVSNRVTASMSAEIEQATQELQTLLTQE